MIISPKTTPCHRQPDVSGNESGRTQCKPAAGSDGADYIVELVGARVVLPRRLARFCLLLGVEGVHDNVRIGARVRCAARRRFHTSLDKHPFTCRRAAPVSLQDAALFDLLLTLFTFFGRTPPFAVYLGWSGFVWAGLGQCRSCLLSLLRSPNGTRAPPLSPFCNR